MRRRKWLSAARISNWWSESCVCSHFKMKGWVLGSAAGAVASGVRVGKGGWAKILPTLRVKGGWMGCRRCLGWRCCLRVGWLAAFLLPADARSPRGCDARRGLHGSERPQNPHHKFIPCSTPSSSSLWRSLAWCLLGTSGIRQSSVSQTSGSSVPLPVSLMLPPSRDRC